MFKEKRVNEIITELVMNKSVLVKPLAEKFEVTEETIRRDLNDLEAKGLALRTHGGAMLSQPRKNQHTDYFYDVREGINGPGKDAIGMLASTLVQDGDTIFLDASSTCLFLARHLIHKKDLTIITNSIRMIPELAQYSGITIISIGGIVRNRSLDLSGKNAERNISYYRAGKTFFSSTGFNPTLGATSSLEQDATIQRLMIQRAEVAIYLSDQTKFKKVGFALAATLDEIDYMVTDIQPPPDWCDALEQKQVKLMVANLETAESR